ncbi:DUF2345 domain-containing protein, partial [Pseudoduganella buxea]
NFSGDGYNQWQLDDTQGQVRMRLATSSAATQLNLGYLIQQSPTSSQRGAYRGAGFELRTDAWAVVRGGEGVLLTTSARSAQGAGVTSTQMDASEALAGFKSAEELAETISDAATAQNALVSKNAATAHKDFVALLDPEQKGKFSGAVNGQEASKAQSGSRELDASQPVEKFGAPIVVMDSPTSINWATPASTVLFAGQQLRWITQGDVQMTAAHTVSSVAANAASFFTHSGGIQAIAANGPVSLQAHTDQLEIVADKSVTVISVNDSIEIKANQKIVLQAGQSSITLEGGDITFACPGNFTVKGGKHVFNGGNSKPALMEAFPELLIPALEHLNKKPALPTAKDNAVYDEQIRFKNSSNFPLRDIPYTLFLENGKSIKGVTDKSGLTSRVISNEPIMIQSVELRATVVPQCCNSAAHASSTMITFPIADVKTNDIDIGSSIVEIKTPDGESRSLTSGEIAISRILFKDSIDYSKVRVHKREFLWFGLQPDNVAMTPNGEIYFNEEKFKEDFSAETFDLKLWFIHEMVHVWQHQLGYPVMARGAVRIRLAYDYTLQEEKTLRDYNMEAQGNLLADYWALVSTNNSPSYFNESKHIGDRVLYEKVIGNFISNPSDKFNLPKIFL